jgi:uncharacterized repeat protein (TIGR02543 family)
MAIGGLSGFNTGTISNCYATGAVTGGIGIGGLTGANCTLYGNNTGTINYCYATGTVTGVDYVGGLTGANSTLDGETGTINNSFYDRATTGQPANGLGTPKLTEDMKNVETFTAAGWNFTDTWGIGADINGGYPSLFWQHTYTVTFDKNGGNTEPTPSTRTTVHGYIADGLPEAPARNGYGFAGWNTAADGSGTAFTAETPVAGNISVYAQWTRLFAEGSGNGLTMDTAFLIATPEHINNMRNYLAGSYYFRLTANIDLSGYLSAGGAGYNGGAGWEPIGTETASFNGHLDGNGHTISGLRINRPDSHNVGLFASSQADIRSLTLTNVDVKGGDSTGALTGFNYGTGTIIACGASGAVAGAGYVGGLAGNNAAAIIECTATGTITGVNYVGGLTGYNAGTITTSHCATGTVSGDDYIGGLAGYNTGTITGAFTTSYAVSVDNANDEYVGGLVGYNVTTGRITDCFSSGSVTGFNWLGGLVGANDGTINNSNSDASLSGSAYFGGLVGINFTTGVITDCYAAGAVTGRDGFGTMMGGLVGSNAGSVANCHAICMVVGHSGVGGLVGVNDGDNISGFHASISNCYASGDLSGTTIIGGLVGQNKGSITESYATGQVVGSESDDASISIGGLAGTNSWAIDTCYATGAVHGRNYVGGLVGQNHGPVTNSHASGSVTGYAYTGGLTGNNYGAITESFSTGTVKDAYVTGGLVGDNHGTVLRCYAAGEVTTGGDDVGGLLGSNSGTVTDSYAAGRVTGGHSNVGGLVGRNYNDDSLGGYLFGAVNRCYSIGFVTGIFEAGGLVGLNQIGDNAGTVTDSFYDSISSGRSDTGKGMPKTTEEMKQQVIFNGWDFSVGGIWKIDEGLSYPKLQWQPLTPDDGITHDFAGLEIGYQEGDSADSVTKDLTLLVQGESGTTISWHSDTPSVIADDGRVTRPADADKTVVLIATVSMVGGSDRTKTFTLTIAALTSGDDGCLVTYKGAQKRYNADSNTYDIRFIATIDTLNAKEVGFVFSKIQAIPTRENASERATSTVYTEITTSGSTITAASLGGQYIIACTVTGIPASDIAVPLYVRAFSTVGTVTKYTPVTAVTVADLLD